MPTLDYRKPESKPPTNWIGIVFVAVIVLGVIPILFVTTGLALELLGID